jgi:aryl-alcohol dehydrogenase-like predicted oxidoreductase
LAEAYKVADENGLVPPTMEQPQYHMFCRGGVEEELRPLIEGRGLGTTTWSPLASGLLTGKYNDGIPEGSRFADPGLEWLYPEVVNEERIEKVRRLEPIAQSLDCTLAQLALAWTAQNPLVSTVITGASRLSQLEENLNALPLVEKMSPEVLGQIDAVLA